VKHFSLSETSGRISFELSADVTDQGVDILVVGGDHPHIGGVVLSIPRPSLKGSGIACDTWVAPVPGHKDAIVAQTISETVCKCVNSPVVVSTGIHVDEATGDEIIAIEAACQRLAEDLCRLMTGRSSRHVESGMLFGLAISNI
jgi:hypothetical protein